MANGSSPAVATSPTGSCSPDRWRESNESFATAVEQYGVERWLAGQGRVDALEAYRRLAQWLIDAIAFVLPRLDATTRTDWLLYGAPQGSDYVAALAGLVLYSLLLLAAGLIDLQRRNL